MDITVQELKEKQTNKAEITLIDVREPWEHDEFNVGGQLIPLGTLVDQVSNLEGHKDKEVIVYCRSGNRSGMAKQLLISAGFNNVRNLTGGMMQWQSIFGG